MASPKMSEISRNQQKDYQSIKKNKKNIEKNYQDIGELLNRIKRLEYRLKILESPKPAAKKTKVKAGTNTTTNKSQSMLNGKLEEMKKRSTQLEVDRAALIEFNKMNLDLPEGERYTWQKVGKGADSATKTFDRIVDIQSLESLLSNPVTKSIVDNIFAKEGGPQLNLTNNIRKKYWVFIRDGKLVTLSPDFLDGVGSEYLWTEDAGLGPLSNKWKNMTKRTNDPRRRHVDPRTKVMWVSDGEKKGGDDRSSSSGSSSSGSSSSGSSSKSDDDGSSDDDGCDENDKNEEKDDDDNDMGSDDDGGADQDSTIDDNERTESSAEIVEKGCGGNVADVGDIEVPIGDAVEESVETGSSGNVSDLGDIGAGCGGNVADVGDIGVPIGDATKESVETGSSGNVSALVDIGVLSGNKRPADEYAGTSSDSDSDSEDEDKRVKMPRVM